MWKRETRRGTVVSIKCNTPYTTDEVIDQINRGSFPLGYEIESATISEVRTVQLTRRMKTEDDGWTDLNKDYR